MSRRRTTKRDVAATLKFGVATALSCTFKTALFFVATKFSITATLEFSYALPGLDEDGIKTDSHRPIGLT